MNHRYLPWTILPLLILASAAAANGQDTFSIVAIDTVTGEVGSAGASCLNVDVSLISTVIPGIGAVHTQARYNTVNQNYSYTLMSSGHTPEGIIDSLLAHDAQGEPGIRQYGVVTLAGGNRSAAYTGQECLDYKGHIVGPTYAIQGNILLGRQVLDSMEARFLREPGTLADKLMAALQGANMPGADRRCLEYGTSSLSAFIRVGRPGDHEEALALDLRATIPAGTSEPIDSLQKLYDRWKGVGSVRGGSGESRVMLDIRPNPASAGSTIDYLVTEPGMVRLALFDLRGREIAVLADGHHEAGAHQRTLAGDALPEGMYYCRLTAGGGVWTRRVYK